MRILSARLQEKVRWILKGNEPATFPFPVNDPGWIVVNPAVLHREDFNPRETTLSSRLDDGNVLIDSWHVDFVVPEARERASHSLVIDFLKRLRYASGQAGIPDFVPILHFEYLASLPAL